MVKVYEFLAEGFEDIEALMPVDTFRRAGFNVVTVSITNDKMVKSAHGVILCADTIFNDANFDDADLILLPGGLPGATNLANHQGVCECVLKHYNAGKKIGAICAAPMILGKLGILKGKKATCYPSFEKYMDGAEYTAQLVTVDGNITTGEGPAAVLPYTYNILTQFIGEEKSLEIQEGMRYLHLIKGDK